jgi:hypothetical protein
MQTPNLIVPALENPAKQESCGTPSVGRIVHYVLPEGRLKGQVRAAMITGVFGTRCNLSVFLDQSDDVRGAERFTPLARAWSADYDEQAQPGTWHWPPRV